MIKKILIADLKRRFLWLLVVAIGFGIATPHLSNSSVTQRFEPVELEAALDDFSEQDCQEDLEETFQSISGKKAERLFHPIIIQAANRYDVDPLLVKAIIMAESSYNTNAVSKVGARGLMQLMPGTARELGVVDSFNPEQNINGGVKYFKKLLNRFDGDIELALAAYNAGSRYVRQYQGVPPFKATQYYIKKVCTYYDTYKTKTSLNAGRV
jgi:soluble lytic murein transglycosylase-like protein